MFKKLSQLFFRFTGWKIVGGFPEGIKKAVLIAAPHTSYWDFLYARAAFFILDMPVKYTIKKEIITFPLNLILKPLGAIPIDRKKSKEDKNKKESLVDAMVNLLNLNEELIIMVTPEGTRKRVNQWKTGFYYVALGANVPIVLGFLDYKKKEAGIGPVILPSGNYEKDMVFFKDFYKDKTAKYPENGVY